MGGGSDWVAPNDILLELSYKNKIGELNREQYFEELSKVAYNINNENVKYSELKGSHRPVRPEDLSMSWDAYYLFLGIPQKYDYFRVSEYSPSSSNEENKIYYSFNDETDLINDLTKYHNSDFLRLSETKRNVVGSHIQDGSLKNFQYSKGKDSKGNYVSYYDVNDYGGILDLIGKSFEIYGRIYYDPFTFKII